MKYTLFIQFFGGRGQSIDAGSGADGKRGNVKSERDFVARINNMKDRNKMSFDIMLNNFRDKFTTNEEKDKNGKAFNSYEHLIAIDDDGFVHALIHGEEGAVGYRYEEVENRMIIHNHPNDTTFSRADLRDLRWIKKKPDGSRIVTGIKGIVASGRSGDYIFKTGKNFDYKAFDKALTKSPVTDTINRKAGETRDEAFKRANKETTKWLKDNASKYGYTFEYRRAKQLKAKDKV